MKTYLLGAIIGIVSGTVIAALIYCGTGLWVGVGVLFYTMLLLGSICGFMSICILGWSSFKNVRKDGKNI